jgi:hypothetical protein
MSLPKSQAADSVVGDFAKYMLLLIQPGSRSWDEVPMELQILPKPGLHAKYLCVP